MKFVREEDLTDENFEKAWNEIDNMVEDIERKNALLQELAPPPEFKTTEEVMRYYNAIPLAEWENKMREKYGM